MKQHFVFLFILIISKGDEDMRCDNCLCDETYVKDYEQNFIIKGKHIRFTSERRFCSNCNSLVYDSQLDNKASEIAISLYNKVYGISKEDIINLRKKFNLSQSLFSKIIGCAKKTLISYEKGKSIPNDSYLIILKSLMASPEIILTIIEANKEQFTDKEMNKINKDLIFLMTNNEKSFLFDIDNNLDEYNGYSKLSKDKIYNIILFFAKDIVLKTKLLKEMFYTDFLSYKETCKSITGLEYSKLPLGPVPDQFETILNHMIVDGYIDYDIAYKKDYECHNIRAKKDFDKSIFTKEELALLKKINNKFKDFGSKEIVDFSHQEKAFTETEYYKKISYDYAFDIKI